MCLPTVHWVRVNWSNLVPETGVSCGAECSSGGGRDRRVPFSWDRYTCNVAILQSDSRAFSRMPKRGSSIFVDSDSESCYDAEIVDSYSDDASKKKLSSKSRSKKRLRKIHASSSPVTNEISIGSLLHSKSSHIIESSGPIRLALLEWYKTVHDIRGMPWRKSYDPSQGPDERAQRAYEVEIFHWIHERCRDYLQFL